MCCWSVAIRLFFLLFHFSVFFWSFFGLFILVDFIRFLVNVVVQYPERWSELEISGGRCAELKDSLLPRLWR